MTKNLPVYKINLQHFFSYPISKIEHNGFGLAVYHCSGGYEAVIGFVETVGVRVVKVWQEDGVFWALAKADQRYRLTEDLKEFGELVIAQ